MVGKKRGRQLRQPDQGLEVKNTGKLGTCDQMGSHGSVPGSMCDVSPSPPPKR